MRRSFLTCINSSTLQSQIMGAKANFTMAQVVLYAVQDNLVPPQEDRDTQEHLHSETAYSLAMVRLARRA